MLKSITKRDKFFNDSYVARILTSAINESEYTQSELAEMLNLNHANVITMFKQGRSPLPIARAKGFALALNIDPYALVMAVMNENHKEALEAMKSVMTLPETSEESELILKHRD